jgi:hypothetical protein
VGGKFEGNNEGEVEGRRTGPWEAVWLCFPQSQRAREAVAGGVGIASARLRPKVLSTHERYQLDIGRIEQAIFYHNCLELRIMGSEARQHDLTLPTDVSKTGDRRARHVESVGACWRLESSLFPTIAPPKED